MEHPSTHFPNTAGANHRHRGRRRGRSSVFGSVSGARRVGLGARCAMGEWCSVPNTRPTDQVHPVFNAGFSSKQVYSFLWSTCDVIAPSCRPSLWTCLISYRAVRLLSMAKARGRNGRFAMEMVMDVGQPRVEPGATEVPRRSAGASPRSGTDEAQP